MQSERDIKFQAFIDDDLKNNRGRLLNCCEEIDFLLSNPKTARIFQKHYLNDLLTYATTFSPFYQQYKDFKTLQDFPILTKTDLKENWDEIVVPQYKSYSDNCIKFTSGSTGTPFKMIMDRYKHCRWIAGNKVFRARDGVQSHEKTVFISETVADKNIPMERMNRDNVYYISCRYFDDNSLHDLICYLNDNDVRSLTLMASLVDRLAKFVKSGRAPKLKTPLLGVFSVSEALKESARQTMSEFFGCPIYILYANEENGVLGVEDGSDNGCLANTADFLFEVLKVDEDVPVEDGEIGRLVITDYFNKAFPIIRYDNGDLVKKKTMPDGSIYFSEIGGRVVDALYTTDGRMILYFDCISFLEPLTDIKQFQLVQNTYHDFVWILNTNNHSYEKMIVEHCKELFGQNSSWTFEYVEEIPKLRSGKTRMTVCNIKHPEK